jgi:hypothetical protein
MNTFQKDISFLSNTIKEGQSEWVLAPVTKTATFKELDRRDKEQHKLHFKLIAIFENFGVSKEDNIDGAKIKIDSDGVYDLTVKGIKTLLICNEQFTVQDKAEFLTDSGAILQFGLWALGEKFAPFFSTFNEI